MALKMDSSNMNQLLLIVLALALVLDTVYGPTEQQQQYSQKWQYHHHHHEHSSMDDGDSAPRDRSGPREDPASYFTGPTYQTVGMALAVIVVAYCFWRQNEQLHHGLSELRTKAAVLRVILAQRLKDCDRFQANIVGQAEINNTLNANLATVGERAEQLLANLNANQDRLQQASQFQAQQNNQFINDISATRQKVNDLQRNLDRFFDFQTAQMAFNEQINDKLVGMHNAYKLRFEEQKNLNGQVDKRLDALERRLQVHSEVINPTFWLDLVRIIVGPVLRTVCLIGNGQNPQPKASHGDQIVPGTSTPPSGQQSLPSSFGGRAIYGISESARKNQISQKRNPI